MKLCFLDLETTGVDPKKHAVIQIALAVQVGPEIDHLRNFFSDVMPFKGQNIDKQALALRSLTVDDLRNYPPAGSVHQELCGVLGHIVSKFDKRDKLTIVSYWGHFDPDFLREWFMNCGDSFYGSYFWSNSIDVSSLASQALQAERPDMEDFKLSTVAEVMGVQVDQSKLHDASYDVDLLKEVYQRSLRLIRGEPVNE